MDPVGPFDPVEHLVDRVVPTSVQIGCLTFLVLALVILGLLY